MKIDSIQQKFSHILPEGRLKTIGRKIRYRNLLREIASLDIMSCGVDGEYAYIEVKDRGRFYGHISPPRMRNFWKALPRKAREKISPECFYVARHYVFSVVWTDRFDKEKYYTISEGDTVVEVGSCWGHYTSILSDKVGESGRVLGIEADPRNFQVLEKNVETRNLSNIEIVQTAVSNEAGTISLKDGGAARNMNPAEADGDISVEVETLQSILDRNNISKVDFLILTINGYEHLTLEGLKGDTDKVENIAAAAWMNEKEMRETLSRHDFEFDIDKQPLGTCAYAKKKE